MDTAAAAKRAAASRLTVPVAPAPGSHRLRSSARRRSAGAGRTPARRGALHLVRARSDEEPDWDKEMSIFKQRTMRPNQLATLRELESKVSLGRVRRG